MSYRVNMMQSGGDGMASVCVERLDHLGVIASVIKELGIVEKVDARLGLHDQEEITAGEALAGMILNGLGFSDRGCFTCVGPSQMARPNSYRLMNSPITRSCI